MNHAVRSIKRQGQVGRHRHVDETYWKVKGHWCCLYCAVDHEGSLVDSLLSSTRDTAAAQSFLCRQS